ncbi:class I SAM-dependent methyltransferase [Thermospira aquatica]|uniref:Class I SAM-dependent methyltransferase n=1 Tax=Thermospira aquatica TaxID=2828656 RepID=A0AAX3BEW5_9SPIR|nr:class I SAM-dependent methyltransferase [Thermospira aquatica]URA10847.1 class I SAM-dependent methyltransferase [Thermospira aquatica]
MKPSQYHSNRQPYNWLVYNIGDKFLEKYSKLYKGILVDLGCGEAPYKAYFLQYADKYIGVDWSKTLHNSAADIESDLNKKINLPDEYADTIISLSVMEHLCEPQVFLNESYRILKKGEYMVLQVPWQWWIHEAPYDYFRYTPYGLRYLFEKAGFKILSIEPTGVFFTTLFLKFNYFTLRFTRIRFIGVFLKLLLIPIWTLLQVVAPLMDKLDRQPILEAPGYFVVARKE